MGDDEEARDLAMLAVPLTGSLQETDDPWLPYRLVDPSGDPVKAVSIFFVTCRLWAARRHCQVGGPGR